MHQSHKQAPTNQRRKVLFISLLTLSLFVGGCWGRVPIDELIIVLAIGIDVGSQSGTYAVTVEGIVPSEQSGDESGGLPSQSALITAEGPTILSALQSIQRRSSKQVFLSHVRVAIFGQKLGRQGVAPIVDHLERSGDLRRTVTVLVAEK